jgi:hypothetical protein
MLGGYLSVHSQISDHARRKMDNEVRDVLTHYDQRATKELALMQELSPDKMMRRRRISDLDWSGHRHGLKHSRQIVARTNHPRNWDRLRPLHVFLAEAARANKGKVITVDISADKQRYADEQLTAAGLDSFVEFLAGDARDLIASITGSLDFVLIDIWKDLYIPCFDLVCPKLSEGAFVAADNILHPELFRNEMAAYRRHVRRQIGIESILPPVGSGIELSLYTRPDMQPA